MRSRNLKDEQQPMQAKLFLDESCMNSCELLVIETKDKLCVSLFQRNCLQHDRLAFNRLVCREIELIALTVMTSSKSREPELKMITGDFCSNDKAPF